MGLVGEVVPHDELDAEAEAIERIALTGPKARAAMKRDLNRRLRPHDPDLIRRSIGTPGDGRRHARLHREACGGLAARLNAEGDNLTHAYEEGPCSRLPVSTHCACTPTVAAGCAKPCEPRASTGWSCSAPTNVEYAGGRPPVADAMRMHLEPVVVIAPASGPFVICTRFPDDLPARTVEAEGDLVRPPIEAEYPEGVAALAALIRETVPSASRIGFDEFTVSDDRDVAGAAAGRGDHGRYGGDSRGSPDQERR